MKGGTPPLFLLGIHDDRRMLGYKMDSTDEATPKRKAKWTKARREAKSKQMRLLRECKNIPTAQKAIQNLLQEKYGCAIETHQVDTLFKRAIESKKLSDL